MNPRPTDPESEVDPAEVESKLRLAVARLRERLTAARNLVHFEALRRAPGTRLAHPPAGHDNHNGGRTAGRGHTRYGRPTEA
ncbi:hypothetical protein [Actinosynnema sp. NPDC023587]|uniref:hypothetical protein n=1 Tax=Actinosynnema sp. NPDC023587 TaxID=3154695 RepID=UPI003411F0B3